MLYNEGRKVHKWKPKCVSFVGYGRICVVVSLTPLNRNSRVLRTYIPNSLHFQVLMKKLLRSPRTERTAARTDGPGTLAGFIYSAHFTYQKNQ